MSIMTTATSFTIHHPILTAPTTLRHTNHHTFHRLTTPKKPLSLKPLFITNSTSIKNPQFNQNQNTNPQFPQIPQSILNSTKTLTTLLALTLTLTYKLTQFISTTLHNLTPVIHNHIVPTIAPLMFASIKNRPSGYLNTPLTVVASGMAKWLDIYSGVLMVRVLLSWFPNIPWDRQPLSAIRDLCDPYLNLFRNIIPPIFDTLDVSPLLAFAVLGTLGSILNSAKGVY